MTNPSIPPCPVCGVVPKVHERDDRFLVVKCCEDKKPHEMIYTQWTDYCTNELGFALFERGIHTLSELGKRLAPKQTLEVNTAIPNPHQPTAGRW